MPNKAATPPNLEKPRGIRFTAEEWSYLTERAVEVGVREPHLYLRMLIAQDMKARVAQDEARAS
jgi:hypothetical protein